MQLGSDLPTFIVLDMDQAARQREVLRLRILEMGGERIEPLGDHFELTNIRARQAHLVIASLQIAKALGQPSDRLQDLRQGR